MLVFMMTLSSLEDEFHAAAVSHLFVYGSLSGTCPALTLFGSSLDFF